jgi:hypothetical protein
MVGLIILASAWAKRISGGAPRGRQGRETIVQQVASPDRQKALQVYENLVKEKLDVVKTALAMGYNQDDLARLDARLEQLIGKEQLEKLSRGEVPTASPDLLKNDIREELAKLRVIGST